MNPVRDFALQSGGKGISNGVRHFHIYIVTCALLTASSVFMTGEVSGDEYKYYSRGKRDPFIPLITSGVKTALGLQVVETIDDIRLEGIVFDPFGASMAMLNGEVVKEGDKAYNVEVVKIYEKSLTIKIYDKTYTVNLVEEGGDAVER